MDLAKLNSLDPQNLLRVRAAAAVMLEQRLQNEQMQLRVTSEQAKVAEEQMHQRSARVQEAMRHPYHWATQHTQTYNEHWLKEGRPSPYEPFPQKPYFKPVFDLILSGPIWWFEKSRDMMLSWECVAYFMWEAQRTPLCGVLLQCQKEKKAEQLISYAKCLWERQPDWLREQFPLARPLSRQASLELEFSSGSYFQGIPGGADQIRSYHSWGYLNDESAFQPDAGECYNEAISAVAGKIIFNSSAGPGWYADARNDAVLNVEG